MTKYKYLELKNYALRYTEYIEMLMEMHSKEFQDSNEIHVENDDYNKKRKAKISLISSRISLLEKSLETASNKIFGEAVPIEYLKLAVCQGLNYEQIDGLMPDNGKSVINLDSLGISKEKMGQAIRSFFDILDKELL